MPLAITGLNESEYRTLKKWIRQGAVIDESPTLPLLAEQEQIRQWEAFFNRPALRNQLVSRYLYEHLFLAHLYFEHLDSGNFFELVRSSTPPRACQARSNPRFDITVATSRCSGRA